MGIKLNVTKSKSKKFEIAPEGMYIGTIYKIVDKGTQKTSYQGNSTGEKRQFFFGLELYNPIDPTSRTKDNRPYFADIKSVNKTFGEKATLLKIVKAALGVEGFKQLVNDHDGELDLKDLVGKSVSLVITHNVTDTTTFCNIDKNTLTPLQPGVVKPDQENESVYLSLEADEFDPAIFETLSDNMKDIIELSPEYKAATGNDKNEF